MKNVMSNRKYITYFCNDCGWTKDYLESEDPNHGPCPGCGKKNCFFAKYIEKKVKRGKIR